MDRNPSDRANRQPVESAELGPEHVVLSHFSLGFTAPFVTRCAAAGAAGFDGLGLLHRDYAQLLHDGATPRELTETAASQGVRIVEIEAVRGWSAAATGPSGGERIDQCLEMAEVFGARHITAVGEFEGTIADAARGFARLCDRAAEVGALVGLEPIPVYAASDIATAREIVERAGRPNGGLCVDLWHLERGGQHWGQLEDLPGDLVTSVQINDGPRRPEHDDYIKDCVQHRRLCGDGDFDIARFVQTLDRSGSVAPISVEIISTTLAADDVFALANLLAATTREAITAARSK